MRNAIFGDIFARFPPIFAFLRSFFTFFFGRFVFFLIFATGIYNLWLMKCMDFTAIDFETMTAEMTSACAIGLVRVENGVIVQKFYSLIKPVPDSRTHNNTHVHGITPDMVERAPTFEELWPTIKGYFEHQIIVAHNASFDMAVLDQTLDAYHIDVLYKDCIDTLSITHMGLAESCAVSGIPLADHHDALCDATACAMILLKAGGVDFTVNSKPDYFDSKMFRGKQIKSETKVPLCDDEVKCKDTPFFHKKVLLTGTLFNFPKREEIASILRDYGADINTSLSKQTDIVIVGSGAGPSKMKKIEDLTSQGCEIRVIREQELLEIMEKYNIK